MIGLSENLFYQNTRTRGVLAASLDEYRKLNTCCDKVSIAILSSSVLKNSDIVETPTSELLYKSMEECLCSLNVLIDYFIQVKVLVKRAEEANELSSIGISSESALKYIPANNFVRVLGVIDNVVSSLEGLIIDIKLSNTKNESKRLLANPFGSYQLLDSPYISISTMNINLDTIALKMNESINEFNAVKGILDHMIPAQIADQLQNSISAFNLWYQILRPSTKRMK
jgi:hypothetical protein